MSYTTKNYKTKKALKVAVAAGEQVTVYNPGLGPDLREYTGEVFLEGPHYPEPHRWYAKAKVQQGIITHVA